MIPPEVKVAAVEAAVAAYDDPAVWRLEEAVSKSLTAAIRALEAAGYKVVGPEATVEMMDAGHMAAKAVRISGIRPAAGPA